MAERVAADLLLLAEQYRDDDDIQRAATLARMMHDRSGQALTVALTDRIFRSRNEVRTAEQAAYLIGRFGVPKFMRLVERVELRSAELAAQVLPGVVASSIVKRVREETRNLLLSSEPALLEAHVAKRHHEHVRINVNQLGEALLGEREALARTERYMSLARSGSVDALSVKVSSIGSQLNLLAFEQTTERLAERLARIYTASLEPPPARRPVVMLDMEAYHEIELTLATLERALSSRALDAALAGVVLQAYVPEAEPLLERVLSFAKTRVEDGGQPLRIRIVKGANLAYERVECARTGWPLPMFERKDEVDANYKRLLERVLTPSSAPYVRIGAASHNVFDLAYALVLASERDVSTMLELEMLEGMAEPLRRALSASGARLLLYAPICGDDQMTSGIAYLVRRLDEQTASDNFLRRSFEMRAGDAAFEHERTAFRRALGQMDDLDTRPRRQGHESLDRSQRVREQPLEGFVNEPDTDFSSAANRGFARAALSRILAAEARSLHSVIVGAETTGGDLVNGIDPSRPGVIPYRIALATSDEVRAALDCAHRDRGQFAARSLEERAHWLGRVAYELRTRRGELIAAMVMDGAKCVTEADAEVSEAIDFAEYYRLGLGQLVRATGLTPHGLGTVVVTPPWNFPLAIAAGGVLAALMAGNRVLLKPALETAYVGSLLAELIWSAGVPREALQLVLCDDAVASLLISDARVDGVILTGATDTARLFQRLRPGLRLFAETGGKNAFIVSAMSDRELSIRDVVRSAFGHSGQKCSAASLLILEAEVYDDPGFRELLADATASLAVGSAYEPDSIVTPLIHPPRGALARALERLEPGESWLLAPRVSPHNPRLVSPGIKLGVQPGSFTHQTELFGPVLGVMRADSVPHAIALANATGYALTAGLSSLDEREQALFKDTIQAGNVYINRGTTGAIVQRQPFGGFGKSGFGPGAKAGGPNYVAQLCRWRANDEVRVTSKEPLDPDTLERVRRLSDELEPSARGRLLTRCEDYAQSVREEFGVQHDPARILGQRNLFRYLPCPRMVLRIAADADPLDVASSCLAATLLDADLELSMAPDYRGSRDARLLGHPLHVEAAQDLVARLSDCPRMRIAGTLEPELRVLGTALGTHLACAPVLDRGRLELLHYLREQAVSIEAHRHGALLHS